MSDTAVATPQHRIIKLAIILLSKGRTPNKNGHGDSVGNIGTFSTNGAACSTTAISERVCASSRRRREKWARVTSASGFLYRNFITGVGGTRD